jgi:hypothetical protein
MVRIIRKPKGKYLIDIHHNQAGARPSNYGTKTAIPKALQVPTPRKQVQPKPTIAEMLAQAKSSITK